MLTQQDLAAIGDLIDKKLDEKFRKELKPIKSELRSLRRDVNELKKDVHELRRDMNLIVKFFDNDITNVSRRVDRLEDYLQLHSS